LEDRGREFISMNRGLLRDEHYFVLAQIECRDVPEHIFVEQSEPYLRVLGELVAHGFATAEFSETDEGKVTVRNPLLTPVGASILDEGKVLRRWLWTHAPRFLLGVAVIVLSIFATQFLYAG
jgi:hypothetical protein